MMKAFPSGNGHWDPKQAYGNDSRQLALSPQVLICPPCLLGHHPIFTMFIDQSKLIIRLMKAAPGQISRQSSVIDFTLHRSSRQRQSSHVSHENVTQSPNPFQHYSKFLGNFTSLASASPPNPP
ncbi:hypothetical protein O181_024315 [Austropuccinia psidii MF-1]|uniref:Uncharacterized protein n=1 Tax=Austropuccinia psidii MF-1 TaxID=1389203 RepID=A0A9Q3H002_9BASI|nr:hypothetical protein [Austropuccinia psidii MF-1]